VISPVSASEALQAVCRTPPLRRVVDDMVSWVDDAGPDSRAARAPSLRCEYQLQALEAIGSAAHQPSP